MQNRITPFRKKAELPKKSVRASSSKSSEDKVSTKFEQVPFNFDFLFERGKEEPCDQS